MSEKLWAAVDIGGTKTATVLSAHVPELLARTEFPTRQEDGPDPAIRRTIAQIHEALNQRGLSPRDLQAIGVSCGNPLDPVRGVIQAPPNLSSWKDVPIRSILEDEFQVRCFLENDANAGAVAEYRYGAGRGSRNMIFLTMGTGMGAGVIVDGRLYRGSSYSAGEIGHVRLTPSGPEGYHKAGSVEGWISGGGVAKVAGLAIERALRRGESTSMTGIPSWRGGRLTTQEVWEAARGGDALALRLVRSTGRKLGQVLAMLIDILNPDCIVIGGLALRMGETLLGPARAVVEREALEPAAKVCRIVPAQLHERIGDIAALCVAIEGVRELERAEERN